MRALVITNPSATAMSPRTRDVIARALGSELKLDVIETQQPGHAAQLAAQARADSVDLVVAVGGDGTVNEVVDGLLGPHPEVAAGGAMPAEGPRLAVVPGGSANVFARALGFPTEPVEATSELLDRLRSGRERRIGLGYLRTESLGRWFTFCAGFGLDAQVVRIVTQRRRAGARATPGLYARAAITEALRESAKAWRRPALVLQDPAGQAGRRLALVVVTNTTPWTYFGSRPLQPTPQASFEAGLDLFALHRLGPLTTAATARRLLAGGTPRGRNIVALHDATDLVLEADAPVAVQVDGDYLGKHRNLVLRSVPAALAVIA
jgi:diacylglycerol kinase family enzyme